MNQKGNLPFWLTVLPFKLWHRAIQMSHKSGSWHYLEPRWKKTQQKNCKLTPQHLFCHAKTRQSRTEPLKFTFTPRLSPANGLSCQQLWRTHSLTPLGNQVFIPVNSYICYLRSCDDGVKQRLPLNIQKGFIHRLKESFPHPNWGWGNTGCDTELKQFMDRKSNYLNNCFSHFLSKSNIHSLVAASLLWGFAAFSIFYHC